MYTSCEILPKWMPQTHLWLYVNNGSGNDLVPLGNKPLSACINVDSVHCRFMRPLGHYRFMKLFRPVSLQWRHNGHYGVSNHQPRDCLLNRLFRRRSKKTSKLGVTGFSAGNSPGTVELQAQMASNAENVSIRWRHHIRRKVDHSTKCKKEGNSWKRALWFHSTAALLVLNKQIGWMYTPPEDS